MNKTVSLISFPLLVMTLLLSTIFSSGIGTASAQEFSVIATIPIGQGPLAVTVNPTNGLVYMANFGSNTVSVISTVSQPPPPGRKSKSYSITDLHK